MHEAGALVAGASVAAARAVWPGTATHAFNAAGGLHHAMPARAIGFCVYDDPAVAIAWLLAQGAERVAYVDVDVHHGDGVQAIFWDEPRVLTISIHEFAPSCSSRDGRARRARRSGRAGVSAIERPAARRHRRRGLARGVPRRGPAARARVRARRARDPARVRHPPHRPARPSAAHDRRVPRGGDGAARARPRDGGRPWVATGGGGYQWARVVPRAWTLVLRRDGRRRRRLPDELPEGWIERAEFGLRGEVPATFSEPASGPESRRRGGRDVAVAALAPEALGRPNGPHEARLHARVPPARHRPSMVQGLVPRRGDASSGSTSRTAPPRITRAWSPRARGRGRGATGRSPCSSTCPAPRCGWARRPRSVPVHAGTALRAPSAGSARRSAGARPPTRGSPTTCEAGDRDPAGRRRRRADRVAIEGAVGADRVRARRLVRVAAKG